METKQEIIRLQNEIMQGLLRQRMSLVGDDLWGARAPEAAQAPEAPKEEPGVASMWHFSNNTPQNSLELRPVFSILGKT